MRLYNTLTRKIEEFQSLNPPKVSFYTCGLTVYDYAHIGNIRTYVNNDVLKRALTYAGYQVKHVMNITDVGHLSGDDDFGEDKLEKGAKREKKTVWEIAQFFTDYFLRTLVELNVIRSDIICKATDHIQEMINLIKILETKGYTYETQEAVYFDVSKFPKYGQLSSQKLEEKIKGARGDIYIDPAKKNPADFSLWFKRTGRFKNHTMHWSSPWGDGFPGWHIECSAMSMKYLGETIDIHAGGVDNIPVHHENEIAQSEAATGKKFVRFWFHNAFLSVEGQKMSKSLGNFYTIDDIIKHGINPLSLRLLFLQTHYRQPMNFTWQAASASNDAYFKLKNFIISLKSAMLHRPRTTVSEEKLQKINQYRQEFTKALKDDLQTPQAIAVMWQVLKSSLASEDKLDLLFEFDQVFGLGLNKISVEEIPSTIIKLAEERLTMRNAGDFDQADKLRKTIEAKGYTVLDKKEGYQIKKIK